MLKQKEVEERKKKKLSRIMNLLILNETRKDGFLSELNFVSRRESWEILR